MLFEFDLFVFAWICWFDSLLFLLTFWLFMVFVLNLPFVAAYGLMVSLFNVAFL